MCTTTKFILYTSDVEMKKNHSLNRLEVVRGNIRSIGEIQWNKDGSYQVTVKDTETKLLVEERIRELLEQGVELNRGFRQSSGDLEDVTEIVKFPDERFIPLLSSQFSRQEKVSYQGSPILVEPEENYKRRIQAVERGYISTR